jgi:hypothetical protein
VARKQPINAGIPPSDAPAKPVDTSSPTTTEATAPKPKTESKKKAAEPAAPKPPKRPRKPIPAALKAIAGLVIVAVVFLIAAVLGGGDANKSSDKPAPASAPPPQASEEKQTPTAEAAEELGYPAFATNNTTRVGGSDPASTAAGVALAVFPSTTAAQRPAAVTIVDEGEWPAAIAATSLMAPPVRTPLLVTRDGEIPDPTSQALATLDPQGSPATDKAQVFAIGSAEVPDGLRAIRVKAENPAALAVAIEALRNRLHRDAPKHIILVPEDKPEFAMPAAAWAARSGDSVLLSGADKLPKETAGALSEDPATPVYVLGPSSAISSDVVREVAKIDPRVHRVVRRVSGEDPVENAIALARYNNGDFGWNINDPGHGFVVARSDSPLDAAISAPLSASGTWGPLLLTDDADTLPKALREYMLDVKPGYTTDPTRAFYNHVWVIGDQEAIDVNQQAEIDQLAELAQIGGEP